MGWLGLPAQEAMVKILKKIPPESASRYTMKMLSGVLEPGNKWLKVLAHLPVIPAGVIVLLGYRLTAPHVTPQLLQELAGMEDERRYSIAAECLMDTVPMFEEIWQGERKLPQFRSVAQIHALHDELIADLARVRTERRNPERRRQREVARRQREAEHQQRVRQEERDEEQRRQRISVAASNWTRDELFPPSPVRGTEHIRPIITKFDLIREGRTQMHCIATYARYIMSGDNYVYRILAPARATVLLGWNSAVDRWELKAIRGFANAKVSQETIAAVKQWLWNAYPRVRKSAGATEKPD